MSSEDYSNTTVAMISTEFTNLRAVISTDYTNTISITMLSIEYT